MSELSCKKVVASGARTTLLMLEERCFGYLNADDQDDPTDYFGTIKRLELTGESVINEIGTLQSAALTPFRGIQRRVQGTSAVGGDINVELANNGYGWLITQAIGKLIGAGTSDDPYTILPVDENGVASDGTAGYQQNSDLYESDEIQYANSDCAGYNCGYYEIDEYGMEPGFTLFISRDGGTIKGLNDTKATNHWWFQYRGCKVNTWSITAAPTEIATSTFGVLGRDENIVDRSITASDYTERPAVNDPLTGFNGAVSIDDDTDDCMLNFEMTLNNNLGTDQFCMGDRYRNSLPEGSKTIEGTITLELESLKFYNKYRNGTSATLEVEFDLLGDGTETMKLIFPKIEYNGTTPTAGGPEPINQELPFIALWDTSPDDSILVKGATAYAPNGFDLAIEIVTAGTLV